MAPWLYHTASKNTLPVSLPSARYVDRLSLGTPPRLFLRFALPLPRERT